MYNVVAGRRIDGIQVWHTKRASGLQTSTWLAAHLSLQVNFPLDFPHLLL